MGTGFHDGVVCLSYPTPQQLTAYHLESLFVPGHELGSGAMEMRYETLFGKFARLESSGPIVDKGRNRLDKPYPITKIGVYGCGPDMFALTFSLCHSAADGYTYYKVRLDCAL